MAKLVWSGDEPVAPGWYWCRQPDWVEAVVVRVSRVDHLRYDDGVSPRVVASAPRGTPWAGPLPEPLDARPAGG